MFKHKRTSLMVWLRRGVQALSLLLFIVLFIKTAFYPPNDTGGPVQFFFNLEPLSMISTLIAAHKVPAEMMLSLVTVFVTLLFGRWFCGWICPFGVLHNLFTALRQRKVKERILSAVYIPQQKIKYYILIFFVFSCVLGFNATGWLDPFSFFFRSMAVAVYPAANHAFSGMFGWLYKTDPGIGSLKLVDIVEPGYDYLREKVFLLQSPFYAGSLLIGILFVVILLLNLYKARFWCRFLCPLGALLGVIGKNPLFRLVKNPEACNGCRICVENCQGGAEPHKITEWKPAECFYCWNCEPACPHEAISFKLSVPKEKAS